MITFTHGTNARQGGMDITLSLTPAEADALGGDAGAAAGWLDTALWALVLLRTGKSHRRESRPVHPDDWYQAINDLDHRLIPRLEGIRDAVIRAHIAAGGTDQELSLAMDTDESTAKIRRQIIQQSAPGVFEEWARSGGPQKPRG